jgi:6-phosphogluconolactonase
MSLRRKRAAGRSTVVLTLGFLAACGGGGSGQYTVGGSVSGLAGSGLVLQNSGSAPLTITASGNFTFSAPIAGGSSYAVAVATQPMSPSQTCTVANGSGTVASTNVTNVAVTCVTNTYSVGGSVSGLVGSGLVLVNNGTPLNVTANGTFAFSGKVASGAAYSVTVSSPPTGPSETCSVANDSGMVASADVKNVTVNCVVNSARFAYVSSLVGIFCYSIDAVSDALIPLQTPPCAGGELHGFAAEPRGKFGYASELTTNRILAYSIDPSSGALTQMTGAEVAAGSGPIDIHVDSSGRFAYVGNYGSADISGYSIDPTTGHLTPMSGSPFAAGQFPNRLTIDATDRFVYVANNGPALGAVKGVSGFTVDSSTGKLTPVPGSPYDTPRFAMDVAVDPATKFVFVTIPGVNAIAVFSINSATGALTPVPGSPFSNGPTSISGGGSLVGVVVDLTGSYLYAANSNADTISGYAIDSTTGALTPLAGSPFPCPGGPYYLNVSPRRGFLIVGNDRSGTVGTYSIDPKTGALTQVSGSPAPASGAAGGAYSISFGE